MTDFALLATRLIKQNVHGALYPLFRAIVMLFNKLGMCF